MRHKIAAPMEVDVLAPEARQPEPAPAAAAPPSETAAPSFRIPVAVANLSADAAGAADDESSDHDWDGPEGGTLSGAVFFKPVPARGATEVIVRFSGAVPFGTYAVCLHHAPLDDRSPVGAPVDLGPYNAAEALFPAMDRCTLLSTVQEAPHLYRTVPTSQLLLTNAADGRAKTVEAPVSDGRPPGCLFFVTADDRGGCDITRHSHTVHITGPQVGGTTAVGRYVALFKGRCADARPVALGLCQLM